MVVNGVMAGLFVAKAHCGWSLTKSYFKGTAEMRGIFKTAFKSCFADRFMVIAHQVQCMMKSFFQ
jgi:hypothetical protein